jgi:hypothetical protein
MTLRSVWSSSWLPRTKVVMWQEDVVVDWEMKSIAMEADRLIGLAADDAGLRADLRALAKKILAETEDPQTEDDPAPTSAPPRLAAGPTVKAEAAPAVVKVDRVRRTEPLRELTLGRAAPSRSPAKPAATKISVPDASEDELAPIELRCRKKADAARWAAAHERWLQQGADLDDEGPAPDPEITRWADTLTNGFYWANAADPAKTIDVSALDDLGGCFEAVAESLALVRGVLDERRANPRSLEDILPLIAEAQSGLRYAIQAISGPDDADQLQVFDWLKAMAARSHVYIRRFMRVDDPADPARWPDLLGRIERQRDRLGQTGRGPQHEASFVRLRALMGGIREGRATDADWRTVIEVVEELLGKGVPPSNREIRELLLPVIDEIPDLEDMPPGFRLVLREIDRFLSTHSGLTRAAAAPEPTAEVKEAARLLAGKSAVMIGGSRRREAQEALRKALGLKDLIWIETKEHQSVGTFEPIVARTDVALILLAIRWSSHSFGDVKQLGERHGKPLVRLPGGYSPNQVAAQIVSQCSAQLAGG